MDANRLASNIKFAADLLVQIANNEGSWQKFSMSDTDTRSVVIDRIQMNTDRFLQELVNKAHGKE
jgi:hypothetical protein